MSNLFPAQTPDVSMINGVPQTTSLAIADFFGKRHADVLRTIENLDCSEEFNQRNFALVEYLDQKGEKRKNYNLTKDAFALVVMGFTGREAMRFKEAYIKRFNEMEATLKKGVENQVNTQEHIDLLKKYVALLEEKTAVKPKRRKPKIVTEEAKGKFKTLYEAGFSYRQIAEQTGYSESTISLILKGMLQ